MGKKGGSFLKRELSDFGILVHTKKKKYSLKEIAKKAGMEYKTLWAIMHDEDLKNQVKNVLDEIEFEETSSDDKKTISSKCKNIKKEIEEKKDCRTCYFEISCKKNNIEPGDVCTRMCFEDSPNSRKIDHKAELFSNHSLCYSCLQRSKCSKLKKRVNNYPLCYMPK